MSTDSTIPAVPQESPVAPVIARERIQVVDARNRPCGSAWRSQMRRMGFWHRATYIVVRNSRHELCVQRRTLTKEVFAGGIDLAAGGVVAAGEAVHQSARRELAEELGISREPLAHVLDFTYCEDGHHIFGSLFTVSFDGHLNLQPEEVADAWWMSIDEALALDEVTPDTRLAVSLLRDCEHASAGESVVCVSS